MTDNLPEEIQELEKKIEHLDQFKLIAEELAYQIDVMAKSVKHIKYTNTSAHLLFSPKIYLNSITLRERNFLFHCGKGINAADSLLLAYKRRNLKPETLKIKLTEKACVEVECFEMLAIACYQYMLKNIDLLSINNS